MTRYKWYRVGLPEGYIRFVRKLKTTSLVAETSWGFVHLGDQRGRSSFRYLSRSSVISVAFDSAGTPTRQQVTTIDHHDFVAFSSGKDNWIRVEDPPRSLRDLLNALELTAGMGFYAESVRFSAAQQAPLLQMLDDSKLIAFKGVGSTNSPKLVARIEVASKDGLDVEQVGFLSALDEYSIDHASYEVVYERLRGQVTFTASGAVRIGGPLLPHILGLLESELLNGQREPH